MKSCIREGKRNVEEYATMGIYFQSGWVLKLYKKGQEFPAERIQIDEVVDVDNKKLFSPRNVITFWWWHLKQKIFWNISARSCQPLEEMMQIRRGDRKKCRLRYRMAEKACNWMRKNNRKNNIFDLLKTPYW